MTTSLTTFESQLRHCLLDAAYGQWGRLGVPYASSLPLESKEIIDVEALLWFSLEFFPDEPRLVEGVADWIRTHRHYLVQRRINRIADQDDPRYAIWAVLTPYKSYISSHRRHPDTPPQVSCEIARHCDWLAGWIASRDRSESRTGQVPRDPSTVVLQARDLLGSDARHYILIYLLTHHGRGKLKHIADWSTVAYRNISEAASRWECAKLVLIDHGDCTLAHDEAWHALLGHHTEEAVFVDWLRIYASGIRLLRALRTADSKGISADSGVISAHCRELLRATDTSPGTIPSRTPVLEAIRSAIRAWC